MDRGSWISVDFRGFPWIVDRRSWIVDRGFPWIVDFRGSWISVEFRLHTDCFFGVHLVQNFPWKREVKSTEDQLLISSECVLFSERDFFVVGKNKSMDKRL